MMRRKTMSRYDTLATYLENLLGTNFNIKYYANKSVEWEKVIIDDEMTYGSLKVIGGQNQSIKGLTSLVEEVALTFMIPVNSYAEITDDIDAAFQSIDKSLILLGEDYSQFNYSYRQDTGEIVYNASIRASVTYYFSLTTFADLILSDDQYLSVLYNGSYVKLKGATGITYQLQCSFDGSVNSTAYQKNYLASVNESIVFNGLMVSTDTILDYIKTNRKNGTTFSVKYYDGKDTFSLTMNLLDLTIVGVVGSLVKVEIKFVQKG